jgi:hypothetical protein
MLGGCDKINQNSPCNTQYVMRESSQMKSVKSEISKMMSDIAMCRSLESRKLGGKKAWATRKRNILAKIEKALK